MKQLDKRLFLGGSIACVLVIAALGLALAHRSKTAFAEPDQKLANGSVELCSDYADLCFSRPADWTRSSILHAGLAKQKDIEINPPTGRILRFEAIGDDTDTVCPADYTCDVETIGITALKNGLNIVSAVFDVSSPDADVIASHTPFVQLVNSHDVHSLGLRIGKSTAYRNFNPGISFGTAPKVMLQISPGKGFDAGSAKQWLAGSEAAVAKHILASVRAR